MHKLRQTVLFAHQLPSNSIADQAELAATTTFAASGAAVNCLLTDKRWPKELLRLRKEEAIKPPV